MKAGNLPLKLCNTSASVSKSASTVLWSFAGNGHILEAGQRNQTQSVNLTPIKRSSAGPHPCSYQKLQKPLYEKVANFVRGFIFNVVRRCSSANTLRLSFIVNDYNLTIARRFHHDN